MKNNFFSKIRLLVLTPFLFQSQHSQANFSFEERMRFYHTPGASIAIIDNYKIVTTKTFGVKEWGQDAPVTEMTLFQGASISKSMSAIAMMKGVQDGDLNLDRNVNEYLNSWKIPVNDRGQPIVTLRQIFSHSSGIISFAVPGYSRSESLPTLLEILNGTPPANTPKVIVDAIPGTQFSYSGAGTLVAQQLLVEVFGKDFPTFMKDHLFTPLQMTNSGFYQPLPERLEKDASNAHKRNYQKVNGGWRVYPELAAAGLWTTAADLAKIVLEIQLAARGEERHLLSSKSVNEMLQPVIADENGDKVAIGFFIEGKNEPLRYSHVGVTEGFVSKLIFYKDLGKGMIIMLNATEGYPLLQEFEAAVAKEYKWPGYLL